MNVIRLLPVFLSSLLMTAHFLRSGSVLLVGLSLGLPFVLFVRQKWAARCVQAGLLIAMVEWIRTLILLASARIQLDEPWLRMAIILGVVALWTGVSACVFYLKPLKQRYKLGKTEEPTECSPTE